MRLCADLTENIVALRALVQNSSDFLNKSIHLAGYRCELVFCEGMIGIGTLAELIIEPLREYRDACIQEPEELFLTLGRTDFLAADQKVVLTREEVLQFAMSGFAVLLIDGCEKGLALGVQGFNFRSISEPGNEQNMRGSREGFVEAARINLTMIRRRMKSPHLKFEYMNLGSESKTDVFLVYMTDKVSAKVLAEIKERLGTIRLEAILDSGYVTPFLDKKNASLFSGVGYTERPDTLCGKIMEGRVGILIDGTPFVLVAPYLFSENFQSLDDYAQRPYYVTFIRCLKFLAFTISFLLPGGYVAVVTHHPELLHKELLVKIIEAQQGTPFPLMVEALIIHIIFEIMREAGLRLPKSVGHAVSIVGALVIGDAAVSAGLIGTPMVLIVALTAVSSFVVPNLYEPVTILKFAFILLGGFWGLYGIALGLLALLLNLCSINTFGIPYTSPISPFGKAAFRDVFVRASWPTLQKSRSGIVQDLPGSSVQSDGGHGDA